MSFRKIGLLFAVVMLLMGSFLFLRRSLPPMDSLEQSSSLRDDSGSKIDMPPENKFHQQKSPQRDIQSEEQTFRPRNSALKTGELKSTPQYNLAELDLQKHELLEGSAWQVWPKMRPVLKSKLPESDAAVEVSPYALIPTKDSESLEQFNPARPIAVFDTRLKRPGVITGTFIITLRPEANPEVLTNDTSIKVLQSFPEIHTYFVTSLQIPFDLLQFKQSLAQRGAIANVETEVLSRNYEKF